MVSLPKEKLKKLKKNQVVKLNADVFIFNDL